MTELLLKVFLIVAPMYFANASALVFGGKTPIDFEKKFFDDKPLLGKGKTFRGTIAAIIVGIMITIIVQYLLQEKTLIISQNYLLYGILLTIGAVFGDIAASFLKRRMGKQRGMPVPLLDQLDFIVGGILFGSIMFLPTLEEIIIILVLTIIMHAATNYIAFKLKMKKVPW